MASFDVTFEINLSNALSIDEADPMLYYDLSLVIASHIYQRLDCQTSRLVYEGLSIEVYTTSILLITSVYLFLCLKKFRWILL
jgi:hypothetical protein